MVRQEGPAIRLTSLKGFTQLLQNQFPTASAGTKVSVLLPIEEVCESSDFSGMIQKKLAQKAG
jgi:hypothetical protein